MYVKALGGNIRVGTPNFPDCDLAAAVSHELLDLLQLLPTCYCMGLCSSPCYHSMPSVRREVMFFFLSLFGYERKADWGGGDLAGRLWAPLLWPGSTHTISLQHFSFCVLRLERHKPEKLPRQHAMWLLDSQTSECLVTTWVASGIVSSLHISHTFYTHTLCLSLSLWCL